MRDGPNGIIYESLPHFVDGWMWFRYSERWSAKHRRAIENRRHRLLEKKRHLDARALEISDQAGLMKLAQEWVEIDNACDTLWNRAAIYIDSAEDQMVVIDDDGYPIGGWLRELPRDSDGGVVKISEERFKRLSIDIARRTLVCCANLASLPDFVDAARSEGLPPEGLAARLGRIVEEDDWFERHSKTLYRFGALALEYDPGAKAEAQVSKWTEDRKQGAEQRIRKGVLVERPLARDRVRLIVKQALIERGRPTRLIDLCKALENSGLRYSDYRTTILNYTEGWEELERIAKGVYWLKGLEWTNEEPLNERSEVPDTQPTRKQRAARKQVPASDVHGNSSPKHPFGKLRHFLIEKFVESNRSMKVGELRDLAVSAGYHGKEPYQHISAVLQRNGEFRKVGASTFELNKHLVRVPGMFSESLKEMPEIDVVSTLEPTSSRTMMRAREQATVDKKVRNRAPVRANATVNISTVPVPNKQLREAERELQAKRIVRSILTGVGQKVILKTILDAMVSGVTGLDERSAYKLLLKWNIVKIKTVVKTPIGR